MDDCEAEELTEEIEGLPLKVGDIVPLSQAEEHRESAGAPEAFRRAHISNSEAFVVTAALKLPFTKGSIVSKTELELFQQKYPGRFTSVRWGITIDDPCYLVVEPGGSPFAWAEVIYDRQQALCHAYDKKFEAGIGADGVQTIIDRLDLDLLAASLREEVAENSGQKKSYRQTMPSPPRGSI